MIAGAKQDVQKVLFNYPYYKAKLEKMDASRQRELMAEQKETVERLLNNTASESFREAIALYYFSKPRRYTWQGVAYECNMHPSRLSRMHTDFLNRLAQELGDNTKVNF